MFYNKTDDFVIPELNKAVRDIKRRNKKGSNTDKLNILRGKPFWIWDKDEHKKEFNKSKGFCCFNHIVGLPIKNGVTMPLFPYQKMLYDLTIEKINATERKGIWIEKATGMGISEFYLRFMGWLATYDDTYEKSKFCIVTGPNVEIATGLIERLKEFFIEGLRINFDESVYTCTLNKVVIQAYPSGNLDSMRGLPNVKFILLDEADFFPPNVQRHSRTIAERYIAKSNPVIVMVSTPNPDTNESLFVKMRAEFDEAEKKNRLDKMIYTRVDLPYTEGLGYIFSEDEINAAKLSDSFETEYNLKRTFDSGNLFLPDTIVKMKDLGEKYGNDEVDTRVTYVGPVDTFELVFDLSQSFIKKDIVYDKPLFVPTLGTKRIMGIDGAFGSSNFAICVVELIEPDIIRVLYADEFSRIDFNSAISRCNTLIRFYSVKRVYIDSANPEVVGEIRKIFGESYNVKDDLRDRRSWNVIPVSFGSEGKNLLARLQRIGEMGNLAIYPSFEELLIQLGIAKHMNYELIKTGKVQLDSVDALRLALKHFTFE